MTRSGISTERRARQAATTLDISGDEPLTTDATDAHGVPLATAIRERLGLKLESQRAPTDVLVVASVERPMPD